MPAFYTQRQGLTYQSYLGIRRGVHAWQATFNRIPILHEMVQSGEVDWVFYLDADAYVVDFEFDLSSYLAARMEVALIAAAGSVGGKWDINAGIFFLNLRHPAGRRLVESWHARFMDQVSDDMLRAGAAPWSFENDQDLLHAVLKTDSALLAATEVADFGFINSTGARFARQVLRAHHATLAERIAYAQREVAEALAVLPPLPLATAPSELGTLLPFLLADWRSRAFFMLLLTEPPAMRAGAWLNYFPRAHGFALIFDMMVDAAAPPERLSFVPLDIGAPDTWAPVSARLPAPAWVLDEASPSALLQQMAFLTFFPTLSPGGYYVIKSRPFPAGLYRPAADVIAGLLCGNSLDWQVGAPDQHAEVAQAIGRIHLHRSGNATLLIAVQRR
jgi:hypothetical protein